MNWSKLNKVQWIEFNIECLQQKSIYMGVQKALMIVQKPAIIKGFCTPIYGTQ